MSITNGERLVTKQDLADFYNDIRPYMGGLVTSKAGFTPIGTIISVMGTTAPVNYLACDGTVYNIADYVELANYFNEQFGSKNFFGGDGTTTFAVPDLRGEFLRGTGTNSHENQGSGGAVGAHQDGTRMPRLRALSDDSFRWEHEKTVEAPSDNFDYDGKSSPTTMCSISSSSKNDFTTERTTYYTVRPTNTSVLYCIATKNFYIDPTLDYSTDEKIVGTWIDGKPIYQKTVTATSPAVPSGSTTGSTFVNLNVSIDNVIQVYGNLMFSNYLGVCVPYSNLLTFMWYNNSASGSDASHANQLRIINSQNDWGNKTIIITIKYTKTT